MNKPKKRLRTSFVRVPLSERVLFSKHMSMMIKSGMTEIESLRLVRRQVKGKGFAAILDESIEGLENGQFLSATLEPYKKIFGELFISLIKLGETTGTLAENLSFLSKELRESEKLKKKVKSAMIYPIIILVASIGVTSSLIFFVLPKILPIFKRAGAELPATTRALIALTDFVTTQYIWIIVVSIAVFIAFGLLMRINGFKYAVHRAILVLPLAGRISKK